MLSLTQMFSKILLRFPSDTQSWERAFFGRLGLPLAFQRGSAGPDWIRSALGIVNHSSPTPVIPSELPGISRNYPWNAEQGNGGGQDTAAAPTAPASPFISPGRIHCRAAIFPGIHLISSMEIACLAEISSQGVGRGRMGESLALDIRAGSSKELQGAGISCGSE